MSDQIIFYTEEQAIEFVNQFPHYKFIREENVVTGSFSGLNLTGANLHRVELTGAILILTNLEGANLYRANLWGSFLNGANLSFANLGNASLRLANLGNASLRLANLTDANLTDANLADSDLSNANLSGANLKGAILSDANVSGTTILSIYTKNKFSYHDNLYASPVYDIHGKQIDWGFHAGCLYGTHGDLHKAIVRTYGKGEYLDCLNILLMECIRKFSPQQQEQQS